jgi:hypothetical protein
MVSAPPRGICRPSKTIGSAVVGCKPSPYDLCDNPDYPRTCPIATFASLPIVGDRKRLLSSIILERVENDDVTSQAAASGDARRGATLLRS